MLGILSDLHFKDFLSYSDFVIDKRLAEKRQILDFIVDTFKDCEAIVFAGDQLNAKNNTSATLRELVKFIEQFDGKDIYMISGNHEIQADGTSAIDFLKRIKNKKWHIVTDEIKTINNITLAPYFSKAQLGTETNEEATKKIMAQLKGGELLVTHYAISDTTEQTGIDTSFFNEVVLPRKKLEAKYKFIISGHIHKPALMGKLLIPGSIFNMEVGEKEKFVWTFDGKKFKQIKLPGRELWKLENPTDKDLAQVSTDSIIKIIITKKISKNKIVELKEKLKTQFSKQGAYILLEQVPREREKIHYGEGESILEIGVPKLLEIYAKARKVDLKKLQRGFELIN